MSFYIAYNLAAENWPAAKLHIALVYFWFTDFSMSHMVHSNGYVTYQLGIKAFMIEDVFINKNIVITSSSQLVNLLRVYTILPCSEFYIM